MRTETNYLLTREGVTYSSSGRPEALSISASDLSHIVLLKILRPTGRQRKNVIFRRQVKLVDKQGLEFKGDFRLQKEDTAYRLASMIAEFYGIELRKQE
ncbi:MAG: hypothetical protein ACRD1R_09435 [Acidobacteriota bacterium]